MKRQFFCFLLIISFNSLLAQNEYSGSNDINRYESPAEAPMIYLGNNQYVRNMPGFRAMMTDLKSIDLDLHTYLLPEYQRLDTRHKLAGHILIIGGVGGGIMMIASIGAFTEPYTPSLNNPNPSSSLNKGIGLLIGGTALILTGTLIYVTNRLSFHDLTQFRNNLNNNSSGPKMEFSIRPVINLGSLSSVGLMLSLQF